jgi:hypothetical protein
MSPASLPSTPQQAREYIINYINITGMLIPRRNQPNGHYDDKREPEAQGLTQGSSTIPGPAR